MKEIQQQVDMLFQNMPYRSHWAPVDQLLKLGAVTLLLKIIAFAYEWNYSGRAETVRSALDVLAIACVIPKVQMLNEHNSWSCRRRNCSRRRCSKGCLASDRELCVCSYQQSWR
ncbi:unnamed protein product [Callosobruchus maculatus]|uniref:Uncharacterized protein n=1 Tax=Callosobruchus maculatus TaxID=64391 RepID=A0A653BMN5_CALMS|nr:unnamed protein product [Callosobruchus maculatus]